MLKQVLQLKSAKTLQRSNNTFPSIAGIFPVVDLTVKSEEFMFLGDLQIGNLKVRIDFEDKFLEQHFLYID